MRKAFNPFGGYHVFVAYPETAEAIDVGNGQIWYFFTAPPPETPGFFDFQVSRDAGATWQTLTTRADFTNPNPEARPFFTVFVNPDIPRPYVWYRFIPSAA